MLPETLTIEKWRSRSPSFSGARSPLFCVICSRCSVMIDRRARQSVLFAFVAASLHASPSNDSLISYISII